MNLPAELIPTKEEVLTNTSGEPLHLPKATPRFPRWIGEFPWSRYGGKPIVDFFGVPMYAEIAILRQLEAGGWKGVWVNNARSKTLPTQWTPNKVKIAPPEQLRELLDRTLLRSGDRGGVFDVMAWKDNDVLFAEAKHGGNDSIRPSQIAWANAALAEDEPPSLLVVEWSFV